MALTPSQQAIQNQIDALDSNNSVTELLELVHAAAKHDLKSVYDSAGDMPVDSAYSGMLLFAENNNSFYAFNDSDLRWGFADSSSQAGADAGGVAAYFYQGVTNSYVQAGHQQGAPLGNTPTSTIQEFSFVTDGNAVDVGDILEGTNRNAGSTSSLTHGYTAGGSNPGGTPGGQLNVISKFPFSAGGTGTDVGDLLLPTTGAAGSTGPTHGYSSGGYTTGDTNIICKYPFAADANATDVGNLVFARRFAGGGSSETYGYVYGGYEPSISGRNNIDKFSFSSDGNATDVGDLTNPAYYSTGTSQSGTHGYLVSGKVPANTIIDKIAFASDGNATDAGDITNARYSATGSSSPTHGYVSGGASAPPVLSLNFIEKFLFSDETTQADVGDLIEAVSDAGEGAQV